MNSPSREQDFEGCVVLHGDDVRVQTKCDQERIFRKLEFTFHIRFNDHIWHLGIVKCDSHFTFHKSHFTLKDMRIKM